MKQKIIHSALFGVVVGDALGVPVEFKSREYLKQNPVKNMLGYLCWNQPPGTWSDDSSLTFCLAESLCNGFELQDIAQNFMQWYKEGYWGAHYKVFDVGGTTRHSILRLTEGESPEYSGNFFEEDNGNGSLMRILPLAFYLQEEEDLNIIYQTVKKVSGITHAHFRSVFACFIYVVFAIELIKGSSKEEAYQNMKQQVNVFVADKEYNEKELKLFIRILESDISEYQEERIGSTGYVLDSLEASLWCLLKENTYESTVLRAVNLGGDTDTTAAISGGLAGLLYGFESIPERWINQLARKEDIMNLCNRLERRYS